VFPNSVHEHSFLHDTWQPQRVAAGGQGRPKQIPGAWSPR